MNPPRALPALLSLLTLLTLPPTTPAAPRPTSQPFELTPAGAGEFELLHHRQVLLRTRYYAWGPNWSWLDFTPPPNSNPVIKGNARTTTLAAKLNAATLTLITTTTQTSPTTATIEFDLSSNQAVDLTGVVFGLHPEPALLPDNTPLPATLADGSAQTFKLPFNRGSISGTIKQVTFPATDGSKFSLALSPPRTIEADWGARLWLADKHLPANEHAKTTVTLTTSDPLAFYPDEANATISNITKAWFPYPVGDFTTPVDLSFLNKDARGNFIPAGAHGFLKVKGEEFVFEDGTPARFWGVNVVAYAAIAENKRATQLAERLARLGVNVVRLHHLDSDWGPNLIDRKHPSNTTQHLNAEHLDQLDFFIAELKKRGIYIIMDPWVGRTFLPGDNVPGSDTMSGNFGLHPYVFYNPRMRELLKLYLKQVWTHTNKYTGLAWKDDPAICTTEIANEFLFNLPKLEPYRSEFVTLYNDWCKANGRTPTPKDAVAEQNWPDQHQDFYTHVMTSFFRDVYDYDRSLGIKVPINASNWLHWLWNIRAMQPFDFMDVHHYYFGGKVPGHPQYAMGALWVAHPPTVPDSPFAPFCALAVHGKPLTSSECGQTAPAPYRSAYYVGLAAVACLQGWDSITPFAYSQSPRPYQGMQMFEFESDPAILASLAAGALIYRRHDAAPARQTAILLINDKEQYAYHWQDDHARQFYNTPQFRYTSEVHKLQIHLGNALPPTAPEGTIALDPDQAFKWRPTTTEIKSDTDQLWRDWQKAVGTLDTPRTQAAYGMLGATSKASSSTSTTSPTTTPPTGLATSVASSPTPSPNPAPPAQPTTFSTSSCTFTTPTPYATLVLSSLTDAPITESPRLLFTTVARAENTGQKINLSQSRLAVPGAQPFLAEPVTGTLTFKTNQKSLNAYPIAPNARRGQPLPLTIQNGTATFPFSSKTLFYEIEPPR